MSAQLREIEQLFEELATKLVALKAAHADDPETFTRIEFAEQRAKRGAELASRARDSIDQA